mmetsp:Transcript_21749/g.35973  ORF Transcript_21749/g.35973 Transcript_21749/m.35973 type:complete len:152 (-) Transcript_21749:390-845(-)
MHSAIVYTSFPTACSNLDLGSVCVCGTKSNWLSLHACTIIDARHLNNGLWGQLHGNLQMNLVRRVDDGPCITVGEKFEGASSRKGRTSHDLILKLLKGCKKRTSIDRTILKGRTRACQFVKSILSSRCAMMKKMEKIIQPCQLSKRTALPA